MIIWNYILKINISKNVLNLYLVNFDHFLKFEGKNGWVSLCNNNNDNNGLRSSLKKNTFTLSLSLGNTFEKVLESPINMKVKSWV